MEQRELQALQSEIIKREFIWTAGQTSVSGLSSDEQDALLGLAPTDQELEQNEREISIANVQARGMMEVGAPAALDWRNNGGDWTTPIKDQKNCGSCVAFGTAATVEARINIACRNPALDVDLSEAHLFYCGCGNCCGTGWNFAPALDYCKNNGIGKEADFPYTPGNQPCKAISPYLKIDAWRPLLSMVDRKAAISEKGPVLAGMAVYSDFFAYQSGVYRRTSDDLRGYHAVCVVGYSDPERCWLVKNSWNTTWGDSGWFRIGYGECDIDIRFPFYDVDLKCPDPCERYRKDLANVLQAALRDPRLRLCLCHYVCGVGPRPGCSPAHIRVVRAVLAILQRCPQFRVPFCRALRCR